MAQDEPFVQSVLGRIAPSNLGQTLMHEHLLADWDFALGKAPQLTSLALAPRFVDCLEAAKPAGVGAVVDMSTETFALAPLLVKQIAEQTSVHIIAVTGCYSALSMPLPGWAYPPATAADIAEHFISAATDGLQGTGVRPGIIKVATSSTHVCPIEETIMRGAVLAQQVTGLGITTHTSAPAIAEEMVAIFKDAGAEMDRLVIGHAGLRWGSAGFPVYEKLAKEGACVGLDNFGIIRPDKEWAEITVRLIEAGYAGNVILSHDTTVMTRGMEGLYENLTLKDTNSFVGLEDLKDIPEALPEGDFTLIHTRLLPRLKAAGVDDATINQILVENPRRILTIDPSRYPSARDESG